MFIYLRPSLEQETSDMRLSTRKLERSSKDGPFCGRLYVHFEHILPGTFTAAPTAVDSCSIACQRRTHSNNQDNVTIIMNKGGESCNTNHLIILRFHSTRRLFANPACVIARNACHPLLSLKHINAPRTPISITNALFYAEAWLSVLFIFRT